MKNALALLALIVATPAMAIPDVVTWAARVENDAGAFNGNLTVTFELFDVLTAGTSLWSETVASAIVVDGDLVHDLGSIEVLDDALIDRDNLFLQVTMNGDVLAPRSALRAVPYALRAENAATAELANQATDATKLGGFAPATFQFRAASGGGLALTGTEFAIAAASVTTARIADGAVTTAKIGAGAITSSHMSGNAVQVRLRPVGCGGGLVPAAAGAMACGTSRCIADDGTTTKFATCAGECSRSGREVCVAASPSSTGDGWGAAIGSLIFAP